MTIDGLLTFLTLAVALFALLPGVVRLRLTLSLRLQTIVAAVAIVAILWLELYEPLLRCPPLFDKLCDTLTLAGEPDVVARKDAFLVVLAWMTSAVSIHGLSRPGARAVPALARLVSELIEADRYGEAVALLQPHMPLFARVSRRQTKLQRLHDRMVQAGPYPASLWRALPAPGDRPRRSEHWPKPVIWVVRQASALVPAQRGPEQAAAETLHQLYNVPGLLAYLADSNPYAALDIIRPDLFGAAEFSEAFLERLIARPGSVLYHELSQNQGMAHRFGYDLLARNRLLTWLFSDINFAERLGVWKPVGNYIERLIDGHERADYPAWLNGDATWFDRDCWRDPTYVGLFYFDLMVTAAMRQGLVDHMWLHYLPHFVDRLARSYDSSGEGIDRADEFPTRGGRLMYEIIHTQGNWVDSFNWLDEDSPHRAVPDNRHQPTGLIPASAATALGTSLYYAVRAGRLDDHLVQTLHNTAIARVRGLQRDGETGRLRRWLIDALIAGGIASGTPAYRRRLRALLHSGDHVLRYDIDDYEAALERAITADEAG